MDARDAARGFWEGAEFAYDELVLCDIQLVHKGVEFIAKLPDAEIAHVVGVTRGKNSFYTMGFSAGQGALQWMRENHNESAVLQKIAEWGAQGKPLRFPVQPFLRGEE